MAGAFELFWGGSYTLDGKTESFGSYPDPVKAVSTTGDFKRIAVVTLPKAGTLPTTDPVMLWDYTQQMSWSKLMVCLRGGAGYIEIAWLVDKAVSSSDLRPQSEVSPNPTTHRRVQCVDWTCDAPFILNTQLARVHGTLATAVGLDGNSEPSIMTNASTVEGRIVRVWASNYATDADVYADVYVFN
ncbi:MAG: hypothetical protein EBR82_15440 [Caulobacteraceae bacterium]|nr:hypothetical protein [Caulobacteraceae bacterium]